MARSIEFPDNLVRMFLTGKKTQFRRPVEGVIASGATVTNSGDGSFLIRATAPTGMDIETAVDCPYGHPGERIWVREPFRVEGERVIYRATAGQVRDDWTPSTEMMRAQSRLSLTLLRVQMQRLHDISEQDAQASGPYQWMDDVVRMHPNVEQKLKGRWAAASRELSGQLIPTYRGLFTMMWDALDGGRGETWARNPWVWAMAVDVEIKG